MEEGRWRKGGEGREGVEEGRGWKKGGREEGRSEVEGDVALHEEAGGAGDVDAAGAEADPEGAAAAGKLPRGHPDLAEPGGPERRQVRMRAAGDRVFRHVQFRIEAARDEVVPTRRRLGGRRDDGSVGSGEGRGGGGSKRTMWQVGGRSAVSGKGRGGGGDDEAAAIDAAYQVIIRDKTADGLFRREDDDHVTAFAVIEGLYGKAAGGRKYIGSDRYLFVSPQREIHRITSFSRSPYD